MAYREWKRRIYFVRDRLVMVDSDLSDLYKVSIQQIKNAVHQNAEKFTEALMFQLTNEETEALAIRQAMNNKKRPMTTYVFTNKGLALLSNVLRNGVSNGTAFKH